MCWLLVTANIAPSSPTHVTLMMEVLRSSDTSVLTRAAQSNIPEDGILQHEFHEQFTASQGNGLQNFFHVPFPKYIN
jgi:hypothetical protein